MSGEDDEAPDGDIGEEEQEIVQDLSPPRSRIIYEVVRKQGDEELARPTQSLFWSGIAAGITITTSIIAEGALRSRIPASVPMREVISELGYSLGFIMVILGRMQLFTEQTIVTVLPVMAAPSWRKLGGSARLWAVVFVANMIGTCAAAAMNVTLHLLSPELLHGMLEVSGALLHKTALQLMLQGVPAGFIIASVAWVRAGAGVDEFWIVLVLSTTIALGGFTHVVAGSAEAFLLLFAGQIGVWHAVGGIILPALLGNVLGGTGLFALLAHAQVSEEI